MAEKLNAEHMKKIQTVLDAPGRKTAVVKEENGRIVILKEERKKV